MRQRDGSNDLFLISHLNRPFNYLEKLRLWLRPPPLTEPEENALVFEPTVRMMGTVDSISPSDSAL